MSVKISTRGENWWSSKTNLKPQNYIHRVLYINNVIYKIKLKYYIDFLFFDCLCQINL